MSGRLRGALAALSLAVLAAGCGDDGGGVRKKPPEEKIKLAEKSAAKSCLLELAKSQMLMVEAERDRVREPLEVAEKQVAGLQAEIENLQNAEAPDKIRLKDLQRQKAEADKLAGKLAEQLADKLQPLEEKVARFNGLRKVLSGTRPVRIGKVVSHTVDPLNEKARNTRTSTMELKALSYKDVLGEGNMKFKLTWRRVERKNVYTARNPKVSYELSHVKLIAGGPAKIKVGEK
jgi:hypothetical protein